MKVLNLAGKYLYMQPAQYLKQDISLLVIRRISDKEKKELAKLLKKKEEMRRNNTIQAKLRDIDIEKLLTE